MKLPSILTATLLIGCLQTEAATTGATCHAINPLARYGIKGDENIFLTGEALWFKPSQVQLTSQRVVQASSPTRERTSYFEHKFSPGMRVSVGYNTPYNGWDISAIYTYLKYKHNNAQTYTLAQGSGASEASGTISLKYLYNQGDLDMGRMFRVSRKLKIRPNFGIRALWLTQQRDYNTQNVSTLLFSKDKIKNTLTGVLAGGDMHFCLAKQFTLYAQVAASALLNTAKREFSSYANSVLDETVATNYNSRILANSDFALGLRWDKNFNKNRFHMGINLGWEQHNFININQRDQNPNNSNAFIYDFSWQAVALGARIDF